MALTNFKCINKSLYQKIMIGENTANEAITVYFIKGTKCTKGTVYFSKESH